MKTVQRSATVAAPQSHMYALLLDVESYPEFVPGCTRARIESRSEQEQVATLAVRRGPLRAEFSTRNELQHLIGSVERRGYTLVPLELYWKNGRAKLRVGLAKGKKQHDKRAAEKDRDWQRDKARLLRRG